MKSNVLTALLTLLLTACVSPDQFARQVELDSLQKFNAITESGIKNCVTKTFGANATIFSTLECFQWQTGWSNPAPIAFLIPNRQLKVPDALTAFVVATKPRVYGGASYRLHLTQWGSGQSQPEFASYSTLERGGKRKLVQVKVRSGNTQVLCSQSANVCRAEHFSIPIERKYLREVSENLKKYSSISNAETFTIRNLDGSQNQVRVNVNELAGLFRLAEGY